MINNYNVLYALISHSVLYILEYVWEDPNESKELKVLLCVLTLGIHTFPSLATLVMK